MLAEVAQSYVQRVSRTLDKDANMDDNHLSNKHELVRHPPTAEDWPLWEIPVEVYIFLSNFFAQSTYSSTRRLALNHPL